MELEPSGSTSKPWDIASFSNSDYAGDPESRKSVSGFILYILVLPVSWQSEAQRCVTLSSSEAEWVALSEAVNKVMSVTQSLERMKI